MQVIAKALYDDNAESALIGSVIVDGALFRRVSHIQPDMLYLLKNQEIWRAICDLAHANMPIDIVTISGRLADYHDDDPQKAKAMIGVLSGYPSSRKTLDHVEGYAKRVHDFYIRRCIAKSGEDMQTQAIDLQIPVEDLVGSWHKRNFELAGRGRREETTHDALNSLYDEAEYLYTNQEVTPGLATGFKELDALTGGLHQQELTLIAARPGMGKTALEGTISYNIVIDGGRVAIFSLEMGRKSLLKRLASIDSGVDGRKIRNPKTMTVKEYHKYTDSLGRFSKMADRLLIDDRRGARPSQIRSQALRWHDEHPLDVIFVDYIGLMKPDTSRERNDLDITAFAYSLRDLSGEMNIPVVALAQLNRGVENRADKRPMLSDLKDSSGLEEAADVVQFLYRDAYYNEMTEFPNQMDVIIAKHRNGPLGTVPLYYEQSLTKVVDGVTRRIQLGSVYDVDD